MGVLEYVVVVVSALTARLGDCLGVVKIGVMRCDVIFLVGRGGNAIAITNGPGHFHRLRVRKRYL